MNLFPITAFDLELSEAARNAPTALELACPVCRCAVTVPADSDRMRVECHAYGHQLVSRLSINSVELHVLEVDEVSP